MDIIDISQERKFTYINNPLTLEFATTEFYEDKTVQDILDAALEKGFILTLDNAVVFLNGIEVPRHLWARVHPKPGTELFLSERLNGDSVSGILVAVATIAIAIYAPQFAGFLLGPGASATALSVATAAISTVALIAVNALIPPGGANLDSGGRIEGSPSYAIEGTRNDIRPGGIVPTVLGHVRVIPPKIAQPLIELEGNDQRITELFCISKGPTVFGDIKLADTDIDNFIGVTSEIITGFAGETQSIYDGSAVNQFLTSQLNQGSPIVFTTAENTKRAVVEITFPNGLIEFDRRDSDRHPRTVSLSVAYRLTSVGGAYDGAGVNAVSIASQTATIPLGTVGSGGKFPALPRDYTGTISINPSTGGYLLRGGTSNAAPNPFIPTYQQPSAVPNGFLEICIVTRTSGGTTTIVDTRSTSTIDRFGDSADFAPSVNGSNQVVIAAGDLQRPIVYTATTTQTLRRAIDLVFPTADQYDVQVTRATSAPNQFQVDESVWTRLSSYSDELPYTLDEISVYGLSIQATDQLNGVVDNLNLLATSLIPWWDGDEWIENVESNNPAGLALAVIQGARAIKKVPDAEIDFPAFEEFHEWCVEEEFEFNQYVDYSVPILQLLQTICAAGRGAIGRTNGKWSVIIDRPQTEVIAVFNQQNSANYSSSKVWTDAVQAFRCRFINQEMDYLQDERIVYDDGFDESNVDEDKIETLSLEGITSPDLIFRHARYRLAERKLRPEIHTIDIPLEFYRLQRGDLVELTHDIPRFGLGSYRIAAVNDNGSNIISIDINGIASMDSGLNYEISIRTNEGVVAKYDIDNVLGDNTTLTFSTPQSLSLNINNGDVVAFGYEDLSTSQKIVKSITPYSNNRGISARVELVDYNDGIYTADTETIPAYSSQISLLQTMDQPVVDRVDSSENVGIISSDGSFRPTIYISLLHSQNRPLYRINELIVKIRVNGDSQAFKQVQTLKPDASDLSILDVDELIEYEICLQYGYRNGNYGPPTTFTHQVIGNSGPPAEPENLNVTSEPFAHAFRIQMLEPPTDIAGFKVYYASGACAGKTFPDDYNLLFERSVVRPAPGADINLLNKDTSLGAGTYCFALIAVDTGGNESSEVTTEATLSSIFVGGELFRQDEVLGGFPGTKTDCVVNGSGALVASANTTWTSAGNWNTESDWAQDVESTFEYESDEIDLVAVSQNYLRVGEFTLDGAGTATLEVRSSDTSGVLGSYIAAPDSTGVQHRYVQWKLSVTGADETTMLTKLQLILNEETI